MHPLETQKNIFKPTINHHEIMNETQSYKKINCVNKHTYVYSILATTCKIWSNGLGLAASPQDINFVYKNQFLELITSYNYNYIGIFFQPLQIPVNMWYTHTQTHTGTRKLAHTQERQRKSRDIERHIETERFKNKVY